MFSLPFLSPRWTHVSSLLGNLFSKVIFICQRKEQSECSILPEGRTCTSADFPRLPSGPWAYAFLHSQRQAQHSSLRSIHSVTDSILIMTFIALLGSQGPVVPSWIHLSSKRKTKSRSNTVLPRDGHRLLKYQVVAHRVRNNDISSQLPDSF